MTQQTIAGSRFGETEHWREGAADLCTHLGLAMTGLGLLYWVMLIAYACSLASGWVAGLLNQADPLARLGDPFMWALWAVYWSVAIALLIRGRGERRR